MNVQMYIRSVNIVPEERLHSLFIVEGIKVGEVISPVSSIKEKVPELGSDVVALSSIQPPIADQHPQNCLHAGDACL